MSNKKMFKIGPKKQIKVKKEELFHLVKVTNLTGFRELFKEVVALSTNIKNEYITSASIEILVSTEGKYNQRKLENSLNKFINCYCWSLMCFNTIIFTTKPCQFY